MGSFTAELQVDGHTYPVVHFHLAFTQSTGPRGQVTAKVRHGHLQLELNVPHHDQLLAWAATPHKALAGTLVTRSTVGQPQEHIAFATGYCVYYHEVFEAGDHRQGAYRCQLHISDPAGFVLGTGAASAPYSAPTAREHGQPPVTSAMAMAAPALPGTVSTCPPDVTARLQTQVTLACKTQKSRCTRENTCAELATRIPVAIACIAARETIMVQCFGGGDTIHEDELAKARRVLQKCEEIYLQKCGPLPQPAPVPQPAPRRQPDTDPQLPPVNPAVPVGLTGAALLLYYLLYIAEGALFIL